MPYYADRVKVATATTGTGTVTLGASVEDNQTFDEAGVPDGAEVRYTIVEDGEFEIGLGTYDEGGGTLTRSIAGPGSSSSTGSLLNLGGEAVVSIVIAAYDLTHLNGGTF